MTKMINGIILLASTYNEDEIRNSSSIILVNCDPKLCSILKIAKPRLRKLLVA